MLGIEFSGVIVISAIWIVTWILWDYLDSKEQPPGPRRLPFFGNLIHVGIADPIPYVGLFKLCKRYGKHGVTRVQMGFMNTIFVTSVDATKDLLNREECISREVGEDLRVRNMYKNLGILFGDGRNWLEMRRFVIRTLRNFGFGKRSVIEGVISSEAGILHDELIAMCKSSIDGTIRIDPDFFVLSTTNIVLWMVTGQRCNRRDESSVVNRFLQVGRRFFDSCSMVSGLYNYWPFLKDICPRLSGYSLSKELCEEMRGIAREVLLEAKASGSYKTSQHCFVDEFLAKMDEEEENGGPGEKFFTEEQFVVTLMDLIQAGSDTTSGSLSFGILLLSSNPEIQDKFVDEIMKVVGPDREPCLDDRDKMPYAQAIILETIRYARVLMFHARMVKKDIWYHGYRIKKGTALMISAHDTAMDQDVWGDPVAFRPERFLNKGDGSFNKEFIEDKMLPFGIGRRACVGEGIAKDTMFLMLTILMKHLHFSLPEDRPKPSLVPLLAMTTTTVPFDVVVKPREMCR